MTDVPLITKGAKRAVVVLFVLTFLLAGTAMWFTTYYVARNNRQFCSLLTAATATRVAKPADAKGHPVQESQWEWQQRYLSLSESFGCGS